MTERKTVEQVLARVRVLTPAQLHELDQFISYLAYRDGREEPSSEARVSPTPVVAPPRK